MLKQQKKVGVKKHFITVKKQWKIAKKGFTTTLGLKNQQKKGKHQIT